MILFESEGCDYAKTSSVDIFLRYLLTIGDLWPDVLIAQAIC